MHVLRDFFRLQRRLRADRLYLIYTGQGSLQKPMADDFVVCTATTVVYYCKAAEKLLDVIIIIIIVLWLFFFLVLYLVVVGILRVVQLISAARR